MILIESECPFYFVLNGGTCAAREFRVVEAQERGGVWVAFEYGVEVTSHGLKMDNL